MALLLDSREQAASEQERNDLLGIDALREASFLELKEQGNAYVKQGKTHFKDALDCYTRAIDQRMEDPQQNSIVYANRSYVNLMLGNYRRALNDAEAAIKLNPSYLKAYFRGSKAALAIDLLDDALRLCTQGLEKDLSNIELKTLKEQIESKMKEVAQRKQRTKQTKEFMAALERRQVMLGPYLYKELCGGKRPWLDSSGIMHWPVLLLYGEVMTSDLIEDFSEFDKFKPHLDTMFGGSSLSWDGKHEYTRDKVELYYQSNAVAPSSRMEIANSDEDENEKYFRSSTFGDKKWVRVDENSTLRGVLAKPDYVVSGIPVFYVVAAGSRFRELVLSGTWSPP